jgi:hypothetical protein
MKEEDMLRLLRALLDAEGVEWVEEGGWLRYRMEHDAMTWETSCCPCTDGMLFFGLLSFRCRDKDRAWRVCGELNRQLVTGALFLTQDGNPVYRCRAVLDDVYCAQERLEAALRYSAQVIAYCWGRFSGL